MAFNLALTVVKPGFSTDVSIFWFRISVTTLAPVSKAFDIVDRITPTGPVESQPAL